MHLDPISYSRSERRGRGKPNKSAVGTRPQHSPVPRALTLTPGRTLTPFLTQHLSNVISEQMQQKQQIQPVLESQTNTLATKYCKTAKAGAGSKRKCEKGTASEEKPRPYRADGTSANTNSAINLCFPHTPRAPKCTATAAPTRLFWRMSPCS